ncbi:MAG: hemerythrin domain-containing protein [Kofleriaceae bacterium]|nr:hemerythrin domain-containing protein [Kofleriaceae bacterium]
MAYALHPARCMDRIADALELLTAQHDEIERLLAVVSNSASPDTRSRARIELAEKLPIHLALEQELFYPNMTTIISSEVLCELVAEHSEIKRILADLLWSDLDDAELHRELATLRELFEVHRAWQESYLFETVAEARDQGELSSLGDAMHAWVERLSSVATAA